MKTLSNVESTIPYYQYRVLVLLVEIWLLLVQNLDIPRESINDDTVKRMRCFLSYIENHYSEDISLEMLAKSAEVSKSECLRCFKLSVQDTPYHYLMEYRLLKATVLLTNTGLSISEIAQAVGFHAQSHFGKLFKAHTGYSPKDYRKAKQQKE